MLGRYHASWSLEGWNPVKAEEPETLYKYGSERAEFLDWKTTPVFIDEEAGPIYEKSIVK